MPIKTVLFTTISIAIIKIANAGMPPGLPSGSDKTDTADMDTRYQIMIYSIGFDACEYNSCGMDDDSDPGYPYCGCSSNNSHVASCEKFGECCWDRHIEHDPEFPQDGYEDYHEYDLVGKLHIYIFSVHSRL